MNDIITRLDNLRTLIHSPDFLEGRGLGNEVNIRIFCYDPEDEPVIQNFTETLTEENGNIIRFNLYELLLGICDDLRITDKIPEIEAKRGSRFILEQLQRMANSTAIAQRMSRVPHSKGDVILIDGVGEVFPFVRVHSLLDAIQPHFPDMPVVVMYPGRFDGRYLSLFGRLKPNPYYRAFNIL